MARVNVELDDAVAEMLALLEQPLEQAAREVIALELYRRGLISSGKAGDLLGMDRVEFIRYAGRLGIPFFRQSEADLDAEVARLHSL